jgi:hypothetical protein
MRPLLRLQLLDVPRLFPVVIVSNMPTFMRKDVELLARPPFRSMDYAVLREGPAMKTVGDDPMMSYPRLKMGRQKGAAAVHPRSPPLFARLGPKEEPGSEARPRIKSRPSPTTESIVGKSVDSPRQRRRVDGGSAALDRERFAQRGHFGSELGAFDS